MGQWTYRKTEPSTVRGPCVLCGKNPQKMKGGGKFAPLCSGCDRRRFGRSPSDKADRKRRVDEKRRPYRLHVGDKCERCGFVPEHICQLDVDHKDGNHSNNAVENLQTLCANCHRLKTLLERVT